MEPNEARRRRLKESYARLSDAHRDLYERAVCIGSLVTITGGSLEQAAMIEASVVELVNEALDRGMR